MVGTSKILTVSYGTFSCTLEGFDDPFNTMRSIAEYFRDLAAEDRYFGAEPPVPDAQMLHRIAEHEVQKRVIARVDDSGVVLRQVNPEGDDDSSDAAVAAREAPKKKKKDKTATKAVAKARAMAADATVAAVTPPAPVPAALAGESIAAKMSRIRAAVARSAATEAFTEDENAEPLFAGHSIDEAFADVAEAPVATPAAAPRAPADEEPDTDAFADADFTETAEPDVDPAETDQPETGESDAAAAFFGGAGFDETAADTAPLDDDVEDEADLTDLARADGFEGYADVVAAVEAEAETVTATATGPAEPEETVAEAEPADIVADAGPDDIAALAGTDETGADAEPEAPVAEEATDDEVEVSSVLARLRSAVHEAARETPAAPQAEVEAEAEIYTPEPEAEPEPVQAPRLVRARVVKMRKADFEADASTEPAPVVEDVAADADDVEAETAEVAAETVPDELTDADIEAEAAAEAEAARAALARAISAFAADDEPEAVDASPEGETGGDADMMVEDDFGDGAEDWADTDLTRAIGAGEEGDLDDNLFDDFDDATDQDEADEAARIASSLSAAEEADLMQELAEVEREAGEGRPPRGGKSIFEAHRGAEASVTRILRETESQLDDSEASRRRSTIAHLKAAVAATRADRDSGAPSAEDDDTEVYRDDLDRVVRPKRPAEDGRGATAPAVRRMAPLMLVSEQRIDLPVRAAEDPDVRPRRVTTANLALMSEMELDETAAGDETDNESLFADSTSFTEYADRMGATDLPELLEAAAAYSAYVEGRPHFSRPQLMKQIASFGDAEFSREDGLRSFGALLRQGKIQKLKRGQFTIAKGSRFRPESFQRVG